MFDAPKKGEPLFKKVADATLMFCNKCGTHRLTGCPEHPDDVVKAKYK